MQTTLEVKATIQYQFNLNKLVSNALDLNGNLYGGLASVFEYAVNTHSGGYVGLKGTHQQNNQAG